MTSFWILIRQRRPGRVWGLVSSTILFILGSLQVIFLIVALSFSISDVVAQLNVTDNFNVIVFASIIATDAVILFSL
jgi:hypothetical protein